MEYLDFAIRWLRTITDGGRILHDINADTSCQDIVPLINSELRGAFAVV